MKLLLKHDDERVQRREEISLKRDLETLKLVCDLSSKIVSSQNAPQNNFKHLSQEKMKG